MDLVLRAGVVLASLGWLAVLVVYARRSVNRGADLGSVLDFGLIALVLVELAVVCRVVIGDADARADRFDRAHAVRWPVLSVRPRGLRDVAIVFVVLSVVGQALLWWTIGSTDAHADAARARACAISRRIGLEQAQLNTNAGGGPVVAFLGDGNTAGLGASAPASAWPVLVAQTRGWRPVLLGAAGSDIDDPGPCGRQDYAQRAGQVVSARPLAVIVQGGGAHAGYSAARAARIVSLMNGLRRQLPHARFALVAPLSARIDFSFEAAAEKLPWASFLDPGRERWFAQAAGAVDETTGLLTDAGQALVARRVGADLPAAFVRR